MRVCVCVCVGGWVGGGVLWMHTHSYTHVNPYMHPCVYACFFTWSIYGDMRELHFFDSLFGQAFGLFVFCFYLSVCM
jgi:hypothetical protein